VFGEERQAGASTANWQLSFCVKETGRCGRERELQESEGERVRESHIDRWIDIYR
jgi:hypothetical protein